MPPRYEKLLKQMRQSPASWKLNDVVSLYEGFGFRITHGSNHDIVTHPDYPQLRQTLPRHGKLKPYIVREAVKLVDRLKKLMETELEAESSEETEEVDEDDESLFE